MKQERIEHLSRRYGDEAAAAHVEAVATAEAKFGLDLIIEELTPHGSVICRAPIDDLEQAYCRHHDGMVDVGLKRAFPSAVDRGLVEACCVSHDTKVKDGRQALESIFRKRPGLPTRMAQQLLALASGEDISGN